MVMIHYICGNNLNVKRALLHKFIKKCIEKNIGILKADTFEFMDNNVLFEKEGFRLIKKERLAKNLVQLWYELYIN